MNPMPESLARHELIGLNVFIETHSDRGLVGLSGRIVDETRNTFLLETGRRELRLAKKNAGLIFSLPGGQRVRINGKVLISQPENRISKRMQKMRWKL